MLLKPPSPWYFVLEAVETFFQRETCISLQWLGENSWWESDHWRRVSLEARRLLYLQVHKLWSMDWGERVVPPGRAQTDMD